MGRAGRDIAVWAAASALASALSLYAGYRLVSGIFSSYTTGTWPLSLLPNDPVATLPMLGPQGIADLAVLAVKTLSVALAVLSAYYTFIGRGEKSLTALYTLLVIYVGGGRPGLGPVIWLIAASITILYMFPATRSFVLLRRTSRGGGGARMEGSLLSSIPVSTVFYLLPIIAGIGIAAVAAALAGYVKVLEINVPPPLPNLWRVFSTTRLALILVVLIIAAVIIWFIGDLAEGILLAAILDPAEARRMAFEEALKTWRLLESWKTWHQRAAVEGFSLIIWIIAYALFRNVLGLLDEALGLLPEGAPWYIYTLLSIVPAFIAWYAIRRSILGIIMLRAGEPRAGKIAAVLAVLLAALLIYTGNTDPLLQALGLRPPSPSGDIVSSHGLWSEEEFRSTLEGMLKSIERITRIAIRFLWG